MQAVLSTAAAATIHPRRWSILTFCTAPKSVKSSQVRNGTSHHLRPSLGTNSESYIEGALRSRSLLWRRLPRDFSPLLPGVGLFHALVVQHDDLVGDVIGVDVVDAAVRRHGLLHPVHVVTHPREYGRHPLEAALGAVAQNPHDGPEMKEVCQSNILHTW